MKPTYEELQAKCDALAAENAGLKSLIEQHAESVAVCNLCGNEEPAETDDIVWMYRDMDTPATDRFLAEVTAKGRMAGINYAASRLAAAYNHGFIDKPLREVFDVVRMILTAKEDLTNDSLPAADGLSGEYAEQSLKDWEEQLREAK